MRYLNKFYLITIDKYQHRRIEMGKRILIMGAGAVGAYVGGYMAVSYTHLRAHEAREGGGGGAGGGE